MQTPQRRFLLSWLPVLLWIGVIAVFSSDLGARAATDGSAAGFLERLLVDVVEGVGGPGWGETAVVLMRKAGHLLEYGLLGFLTARAVASTTAAGGRGAVLGALVVVLAVGGADELHQSTLPSRTGSVFDVGIDLMGALGGAVLWHWSRRSSRSGAARRFPGR